MANKRLPGWRKSAGRISTSAKKLVALKAGSAGVAISELPDTEKLSGKEFFPVVQDNETRKVPLEELSTLISVDGINAQGGNFCLSPVAYRLANSQGSPTTFKAEYLNEAISVTYRIYFGTNGSLRLDFSKWDFDFNESQNYKIILTNNSSGEFSIIAPGNGLVINNDGTVGEPEIFKIDTNVTIIEITQSSHDSKLILRRLTPYEPGKDGESAYSFWASMQPEGADICEAAFLKSMEGKPGDEGRSAYQIWLDAGNEGTEDDFLKWLSKAADINLDASPKNILSQTEDGLLVDGTHPVIPKYSEASSWQVFPEPEEIPGGYFVYSRVLTVKNPVGAILVNDWPIYKLVRGNIGGLYYDADDNLLDVRCIPIKWIVSNKKIDITFHVIMSGKPHKSLSLYSLVEDGNEDEGTLYLKLEAQVLTGATLNQLGME